ncbi:hypothetical protein NCCP1664_17450 [Zafaria cholistanensis]|uniref:Uncharacterized protein n=1 Tax=Zafaria cholistanensis TaxID=1682741 RepID=A0A5A7NRA7_9MICC|nr:hypothetical protein [Zafaria cholistanensis]GER23249.1 hypothetical protein NCCP1664_17450 [Zafaria cholistanensis]
MGLSNIIRNAAERFTGRTTGTTSGRTGTGGLGTSRGTGTGRLGGGGIGGTIRNLLRRR